MKTLITLSLLLLCSFVSASEVDYDFGDTTIYDFTPAVAITVVKTENEQKEEKYKNVFEAIEASKIADKRILFIFTAKWCGPCKTLKKNIEPLFKELRKTHVIYSVDVDVESKFWEAWQKSFKNNKIPAYAVVTQGNETVLSKGIGLKTQKQFQEWLDKIDGE